MRPSAEIDIGYGVDAAGRGVAYARTSSSVLRLPFRIAQRPLLLDRAGGYAALGTVARALQKRGIGRARFRLPDRQLVDELTKRSQPPDELSLANVRARCALNALAQCEIEYAECSELMQRARAEVALNLAA
jgi:hypothetical protein